jgi:hypothetical protein
VKTAVMRITPDKKSEKEKAGEKAKERLTPKVVI